MITSYGIDLNHSHDEPKSRKIGYLGRPGSYGNLPRAKFGHRLDTGIDSAGDVDAPDATFGYDESERDDEKRR